MDSQVIQSKDKTATITSFSIETLKSDLKMNFSVIVLILLRYSIPLARAGPNEYDVRPVGVWSGPPKRRSEMTRGASWDTSSAETFFVNILPLKMEKALKNSLRLENTIKAEDCPPGMWAYKKRMITSKQMLRKAVKKSKQSKRHVAKRDTKRACPPGISSCSAKKQSKIRRAAGSYPPIWTRYSDSSSFSI